MKTFIKLYDWTTETDLNLEERVILSLITQFTEQDGFGYWGGFSLMSSRTGISKSRCKEITEKLINIGAISRTTATHFQKKRIVLTTNLSYVEQFSED